MRSLANSDSVFESACDFDEVLLFVVLVVSYYFVQNLLDDTVEEGEITSEVFELVYFGCLWCLGGCRGACYCHPRRVNGQS